jgi:hypothetical protein
MDETTNETRYKVLSNGAVYDLQEKRIVKGAAMSSDDAAALVAKRIEKRRQVIKEAANGGVLRKDYIEKYGDLAFVAAITETQMIKATTPDDPKSTEAARWIMRESGESEELSKGGGAVELSEMRGLLRDIAMAAREIEAARRAND